MLERIYRGDIYYADLTPVIGSEQGGIRPVLIMGRDPVEHAKRVKYKPPAMRVRDDCYTKKSPFRYNGVVQALL